MRNLSLSLSLSLLVLLAASAAQAARVDWRNIGRQAGATRIAACADGRLYTLDGAGTLRVNRAPAAAGAWERVGVLARPNVIFCAGNRVHHLDSARNIFKAGSTDPLALPAAAAGSARGAREIAGTTVVAFIFPVNQYFAINDDNTLWMTSDTAGAWRRMGLPGGANHIAVGGGFMESRVFALNHDRNLFMNAGNGCDEYWLPIDRPGAADQIAASGMRTLFALNDDDSLWIGNVVVEQASVSMTSAEFAALINPALAGSRVRMHSSLGSFTPSALLASFGIPGSTFGLPIQNIALPTGDIQVSLNDMNLSRIGARLAGGEVLLDLTFEEASHELAVTGVPPDYDIIDARGTLHFDSAPSECNMPVLSLVDAEFFGRPSAIAIWPANEIWNALTSLVVDARAVVETSLLTTADGLFNNRPTAIGLQRALLEVARLRTGGFAGARWGTLVGPTFQLSGGRISYMVER